MTSNDIWEKIGPPHASQLAGRHLEPLRLIPSLQSSLTDICVMLRRNNPYLEYRCVTADIKAIAHIFLRIRRMTRTAFPNLSEQRHVWLPDFRNGAGAHASSEFAILRVTRTWIVPAPAGTAQIARAVETQKHAKSVSTADCHAARQRGRSPSRQTLRRVAAHSLAGRLTMP